MKGALGAHFYKTHGRRAAYRQVVGGTVCHACPRNYSGRTRLAVHLRDLALWRTTSRVALAAADGADDYTPALPEPTGGEREGQPNPPG